MESSTISPAVGRAVEAPTLGEALRRTAALHPDIVAVRTVDDSVSLTWSELLARVQALIRRAGGVSEPTQLVVGNLSMNLLTRDVIREGRRIELQPIEFSLLEYLMRNTGRVVSKTMIMEHVWDYNFDPQTNVVEARISRLRDKLDRDFSRKLIHTMRGVGYVLRENP